MWIAYQNNSGSPLWMVVGYYSPNCDGQDWAKKGWWRINPGGSITAIWTTSINSLFYAEADDGRIWAGPYTTFVPVPGLRLVLEHRVHGERGGRGDADRHRVEPVVPLDGDHQPHLTPISDQLT